MNGLDIEELLYEWHFGMERNYLVELAVDLEVREGWKEERILDNVPIEMSETFNSIREMVDANMGYRYFDVHNEDQKMAKIEVIRLISRKVGIIVRKVGECERVPNVTYRNNYLESGTQIGVKWKHSLPLYIQQMACCNYFEQTESEGELEQNDIDAVLNSLRDINTIEDLFPDKADRTNCLTNKEKSRLLLLVKAFPALRKLKSSFTIVQILLELSRELDNLPQLICEAVDEEPLALLLIGGLLSFKERTYDTWNRVKDDLIKIKEAHNGATNNHRQDIIAYCYDDLSHFHQSCFLYLACYPIDYEIPARSLTQIWIADTLFPPEEGVTIEDTANNYLEQLVERSLVCVSKRSFSGPIKCCRVRQSILEFAIKQNHAENFFSINPEGDMYIGERVAFNNADTTQCTEVANTGDNLSSLLAFDCHRNAIKKNLHLVVLELRKSTIPEIDLLDNNMFLKYLSLRGNNTSELPENIGDMYFLQTLDVRDTSIKTLPESLWDICFLRHVYVNYSRQIKGPHPTANLLYLQTLKTVGIPESWLENFPKNLINLKKLALSNRDNQYWESISNLLSSMVNLLSMTIIGDIVPSEFVDTRAFSNLKTVKSIKFEGEWKYRNLIIDNIKFPSNLTKLTLTKSGLKEDPMPSLERLQSLKYLSLQDGAYIGNKIVCSENGFPQLQFLELNKLEKLEYWEVNPRAMPHLTTLRVVQCVKLMKNLSNLDNVKFPPNFTKLTLIKSGLKEDPMPRLEKLESLKYLSLQDGAYIGNKMVCSENGFPQLQFLELKKLEKLENWEVNPRAMPRLITLRVVQCLKLKKLPDRLKNLPDAQHVPNEDIYVN
ncbi:protein RECOGNITION OF PERONOSPORA PARASITICA 7-like [Carex rostrata]